MAPRELFVAARSSTRFFKEGGIRTRRRQVGALSRLTLDRKVGFWGVKDFLPCFLQTNWFLARRALPDQQCPVPVDRPFSEWQVGYCEHHSVWCLADNGHRPSLLSDCDEVLRDQLLVGANPSYLVRVLGSGNEESVKPASSHRLIWS